MDEHPNFSIVAWMNFPCALQRCLSIRSDLRLPHIRASFLNTSGQQKERKKRPLAGLNSKYLCLNIYIAQNLQKKLILQIFTQIFQISTKSSILFLLRPFSPLISSFHNSSSSAGITYCVAGACT